MASAADPQKGEVSWLRGQESQRRRAIINGGNTPVSWRDLEAPFKTFTAATGEAATSEPSVGADFHYSRIRLKRMEITQ